jgi:hypothetical protein
VGKKIMAEYAPISDEINAISKAVIDGALRFIKH